MISKRRAQSALVVFFTIMVFSTMMIVEAAYESQTIRITGTSDDGFVTESGIMWVDSTLIHILDPNMEIRAFLMFESIEINTGESLNNATLRLRPGSAGGTDPGSNVYIYGVKQPNFLGFFSPSDVTGAIRTSAYVNLNTSVFASGAWTEIDVTNIISELINHPAWEGDDVGSPSDNIGFVISGPDAGYDTRYFYDESAGNGLEAQLVINWGAPPPPPTPPPGDPPLDEGTEEFNETYRELEIWEIDHLTENRTGANVTVNWNLLSMNDLTELDSGGAINIQNDTWTTLNAFADQQVNSLYNDTGALNVTGFFVRFAMNITNVSNGQAGSAYAGAVVGLGTATPVGSIGMQSGAAGQHAGLLLMINADDSRYLFRLYERSGVDRRYSSTSGWITENTGIHYFEYNVRDDWEKIVMYSDPEFEVEVWNSTRIFEVVTGPFRYLRVIESVGQWGPGAVFINLADYYTYDTMPVALNTSWRVTYPNGTVVPGGEDLDSYDDAIALIEDLLGADPSEPTPPGQGWDPTGPLSRFRMRLYILVAGIVMVFGPLMYWAISRPSGYEFVIGAFIMFVGFALMYAAGQV